MFLRKALWITALFVEAEELLEFLGVEDLEWEEKDSYYIAEFSHRLLSITLIVSGIGLDRAELALENHLSENKGYDFGLAFGFAGGLVKTSRAGDLVLPSSVAFKDESYRPCPEIYGRFLQSAQARPEDSSVLSLLVSVEEVVGSIPEKAALHAASGGQAVDMEVAAWARTFDRFQIAWVAVKSILDAPTDEISTELRRLADAYGRVQKGKVVSLAFRNPLSLLEGWKFHRRIQKVAKTYSKVISDFVKTEEDRQQANDPAVEGKNGELSTTDPLQEKEKGKASHEERS